MVLRMTVQVDNELGASMAGNDLLALPMLLLVRVLLRFSCGREKRTREPTMLGLNMRLVSARSYNQIGKDYAPFMLLVLTLTSAWCLLLDW